MANQFVNLPVPSSNTSGAAVDVGEMGATKTIVVGGPFKGTVEIEFSTDDTGAGPWAPVPAATFVNKGGRVTADFAARWMRASMQNYQSGTPNADVGGSGAGSTFALLTSAPTDISALPALKTVVSAGAAIVEISLDGVSWSQAFSLQNAGAETAVVYGALARTNGPSIWMGGADNSDSGTPPFPQPQIEETVYARLTGSDITGNGTLASPYRTFQRAIRDVPHVIPPGYIYTVDITGIGLEQLPADYQFPAIHAPRPNTYGEQFGGLSPFPFFFGSSFNVRAFPQPASSIPLADTSIPVADIVSVTSDPVTQLQIVTVSAPRASWAGDALKGLFITEVGNALASSVIYASDATHLYVTTNNIGAFAPLADLAIVECSAHLRGEYTAASDQGCITIANTFYMALQGIKFSAIDSVGAGPYAVGLYVSGGAFPQLNMCDLEGVIETMVSTNFTCWACFIHDKYVAGDGGAFTANQALLFNIPDFFMTGTTGNVTSDSVYDGCPPIQPGIAYSVLGSYDHNGWNIRNTLIKNCLSPVGGVWALNTQFFPFFNVQIDNPIGPGITVEGPKAFVILENVSGTNLDYGIIIKDGGTARVLDDATNITGGTADMKVGTLPDRSWVDFRTVAPIKNQYDLVSPPVGDEVTGAGTGGTSGSRLFQRGV